MKSPYYFPPLFGVVVVFCSDISDTWKIVQLNISQGPGQKKKKIKTSMDSKS